MKDRLFACLDEATQEVAATQSAVNLVHASRNNYNHIVQVPYTHKFNVSCGG